jgi:hypothetical protein
MRRKKSPVRNPRRKENDPYKTANLLRYTKFLKLN